MTSNIIIQGDSNLKAENIKKGISILGVAGNYASASLKKYQAVLKSSSTKTTFPGTGVDRSFNAYYVTVPALDFTPVWFSCSTWSSTQVCNASISYYWDMFYNVIETATGSSNPFSGKTYTFVVTLSKSGFKLPCLGPNNTTVGVLVYGY